MAKNRTQRKKLWDRNPNCHYCGCETVLPENLPHVGAINTSTFRIKSVPKNMATIEHLNSRLIKTTDHPFSHVIACVKCNGERNNAEIRALRPVWTEISKAEKLRDRKKIAKRFLAKVQMINPNNHSHCDISEEGLEKWKTEVLARYKRMADEWLEYQKVFGIYAQTGAIVYRHAYL